MICKSWRILPVDNVSCSVGTNGGDLEPNWIANRQTCGFKVSCWERREPTHQTTLEDSEHNNHTSTLLLLAKPYSPLLTTETLPIW